MPFKTSSNEISIHTSREGGDEGWEDNGDKECISIHTSREGGDAAKGDGVTDDTEISIHTSREGGDQTTKKIS